MLRGSGKPKTKAHYVNGRFRRPKQPDGELRLVDPGDLERTVWATATQRELIDRAVEVATETLDRYRERLAHDWPAFFRKLKAQVLNRRQGLVEGLALATGRPAWETELEVKLASALVDRAARRGVAPLTDLTAGGQARVPAGVLALFTVSDLPLIRTLTVLVEGLPAGNCVILMPPAGGGALALLLAEMLHECDLPRGTFALVHGDDDLAGHLARHPGVHRSVPDEGALPSEAGTGEHDGLVRAGDDLERAARTAALGAFLSSGQRFDSLKRIFAEAEVARPFAEALARLARQLVVGHPLTDGSHAFLGPLASDPALTAYLEFAESGPGSAVLEGGELTRATTGRWVSPTVRLLELDEARPARLPPGPASLVLPVSNMEEVLVGARADPRRRTFCFLDPRGAPGISPRALKARFVGRGITAPGSWLRRAQLGEVRLPWESAWVSPLARAVHEDTDERPDPAAQVPGFPEPPIEEMP